MVCGGLRQKAQGDGSQQDDAGEHESVLKTEHFRPPGNALARGKYDLSLGIGDHGGFMVEGQRHGSQAQPDFEPGSLHRENFAQPDGVKMNGVGDEGVQQGDAQ